MDRWRSRKTDFVYICTQTVIYTASVEIASKAIYSRVLEQTEKTMTTEKSPACSQNVMHVCMCAYYTLYIRWGHSVNAFNYLFIVLAKQAVTIFDFSDQVVCRCNCKHDEFYSIIHSAQNGKLHETECYSKNLNSSDNCIWLWHSWCVPAYLDETGMMIPMHLTNRNGVPVRSGPFRALINH